MNTGIRFSLNLRYLSVAAFLIASASMSNAQLPVTQLSAIAPSGLKVGSESELRVTSGSHIDEVSELRFSHEGIKGSLLTDDPLPFQTERQPRYGHFRVSVPDDVPAGRYEVRATGRFGVSNPRAFFVFATDTHSKMQTSNDPASPVDLPLDAVIQCQSTAAQIDYFRFAVQPEQTVRIDLIAAKSDSRMIGHLELQDHNGRIIQSVHGSDEIDPHILVSHKARGGTDQELHYTLAVHDAIFRGGADYGYQLSMHEVASDQTLSGVLQVKPWYARLTFDPKQIIDRSIEIEESTGATPLECPCTITAQFDSSGDVDQYEFRADANDKFVIDLLSERLGQPTDARIEIQRAEVKDENTIIWHDVANADDGSRLSDGILSLHSKDPTLLFKAPQAATYRVTVRDLDRGRSLGEVQRYWIDFRKPTPRFDLVTYPHPPLLDAKQATHRGSQVVRGGSESIRVFAIRHDGWTGPIELSVGGLPAGTTCDSATIAANQNQSQLVITADESAPATSSQITITGKAKVGDTEQTVVAQPVAMQWGRGGQRDFHRFRQTQDLTIAVSESDVAAVSVNISSASGVELKKGGELKLPIKLIRREGGKGECTLRTRDLPPNVTAAEVKIPADKSAGELILKAKTNAAAGTYSLWLQCETKIKHKSNPQLLGRAQTRRDNLQKLLEEPANQSNAIKSNEIKDAIALADKTLNAAKKSTAEKDLTIFVASHQVTIRIIE